MRNKKGQHETKDIAGIRYNKLTAIKFHHKTVNEHYWEFQCDCGKSKVIRKSLVTNGIQLSCGCEASRRAKQRAVKQFTTHGLSKTRFYRIYKNIEKRCKFDNRYVNVDNSWKSFEEFKKDMYKKYKEHAKIHGEKNTSIDRIDNKGDYSKHNCRWATQQKQMNNTSRNVLLKFNNKTKTATEWGKELKIKPHIIRHRKNVLKWSDEESLTVPVGVKKGWRKKIEFASV